MLAEMESAFNLAELNLIHNETITKEVIQALDEIHERKMSMIADNVPKAIQTAFRDFAGVKYSQIYNAFQEGKAVYLAKTFQKVLL